MSEVYDLEYYKNHFGIKAGQTHFDKNISGISANNVQGAIDELKGTIGYSKKNLLIVPYIDFNKTENGVTWVINSDYTVMGTGTSTVAEAEFLCTQRQNHPLTLKAGTYILSGCPKGGSDSTYYMKLGKTGSNGGYELMGREYGEGFIFTLTEETKLGISCDFVQGYKATDVTFKPMIRLASIQDDTYEPYVADVQTTLNNNTLDNLDILLDINVPTGSTEVINKISDYKKYNMLVVYISNGGECRNGSLFYFPRALYNLKIPLPMNLENNTYISGYTIDISGYFNPYNGNVVIQTCTTTGFKFARVVVYGLY